MISDCQSELLNIIPKSLPIRQASFLPAVAGDLTVANVKVPP